MDFNGELESIISIADGTLPETRVRLQNSGPARVAVEVLREVLSRTVLFPGPASPVRVQFELWAGEKLFSYRSTLGVTSPVAMEGSMEDPHVILRQDLAELLRAVYGGSTGRCDATRSLWIMNEPGPETDNPDDPWLLALRAATQAAGQIVSAASPYQAALGSLARQFGSDKWGDHFYTAHYERHLSEYRDQRIKLLEIGIGGFESETLGGESLRMWKHYFRRGLIYGLDLFDKSRLNEPRIQTLRGDQADTGFLNATSKAIGEWDIIIDDGSHLSADVIASFSTLFPFLADGGLYVIEDLQTSYWPGWNGRRSSLNDPQTTVGFLKTLLDGLHHQDRLDAETPGSLAGAIRAVHIYRNIAFIEKGVNQEQTAPSWVRRYESDMDLVPKGSMRRITVGVSQPERFESAGEND